MKLELMDYAQDGQRNGWEVILFVDFNETS